MIKTLATPPSDSLLNAQLNHLYVDHQDTFLIELDSPSLVGLGASEVLVELLDAFINSPPRSVTWMMFVRNLMVKPLGLRTAKLGCPVSSLASADKSQLFKQRFPVLAQQVNDSDTLAQVILGANDKHLVFRSCVAVSLLNERQITFSLGNRVHCLNAFGRFYMFAIGRVHRRYVGPLMLEQATQTLLTR